MMKKILFILLIGLLLSCSLQAFQPKNANVDDWQTNELLRQIFERSFNLLPIIVSTVPTSATLSAGQVVWYVSGDTERLYYNLNGTVGYLIGDTALTALLEESAVTNGYPQRATMLHDEATVIHGNAIISEVQPNRYQTYSYQGTAANGNSFSNSFFLKAGAYTFFILGSTRTTAGKIDWYIDGVKVVSLQDWYSDPAVLNVVKTASVTVTGDGYHQLIGTVNGKHASSGGYYTVFTKYWLKPVADGTRD